MIRRDWYWLGIAVLAAVLAWGGKPLWDDWTFVRTIRLSQETQLQQAVKQLQQENAELKAKLPK